MKDVFSGISNAFGGNTEAAKNEEKPKASNDLTKKVGFEITKKGFSSSDFSSTIDFTFQLTNNTPKDMGGVEGIISLNDIFGNPIREVHLSYDEGIKAGETKLYSASIDYNKFMDAHIKLRSTDLSKLKYDWQVSKIVYADGSTEAY